MGIFKTPKIENIESTIDNKILYDPKSFVIISVRKVFKKNDGKALAWSLVLFDPEQEFVEPDAVGVRMKAIPVSSLRKFKIVNDKFEKRLEKLKEKQTNFVENNSDVLDKNPEARKKYYQNISDITNILALINVKKVNEGVFEPKTDEDLEKTIVGKLIWRANDDTMPLTTLNTVYLVTGIDRKNEDLILQLMFTKYHPEDIGKEFHLSMPQGEYAQKKILTPKMIQGIKNGIKLYKKHLVHLKPGTLDFNETLTKKGWFENILAAYEKGEEMHKEINESIESIFKPKEGEELEELIKSQTDSLWYVMNNHEHMTKEKFGEIFYYLYKNGYFYDKSDGKSIHWFHNDDNDMYVAVNGFTDFDYIKNYVNRFKR